MTCVAGLVHDGKVYLGGDSAAVLDNDLAVRNDPKVFRDGPYVIGFSGSFRVGQLARHAFDPPDPPIKNLTEFMVTTFVDSLRDTLKTGNVNELPDDTSLLVGVRGQLFEVGADWQIGEYCDGYTSIGCGANLAIGSLYSTAGMAPRTRIQTALGAAERGSAGVRGPFTVVVGGGA